MEKALPSLQDKWATSQQNNVVWRNEYEHLRQMAEAVFNEAQSQNQELQQLKQDLKDKKKVIAASDVLIIAERKRARSEKAAGRRCGTVPQDVPKTYDSIRSCSRPCG